VVENKMEKDKENMRKNGSLRWELKQQHPGYSITHHYVIINVLGVFS